MGPKYTDAVITILVDRIESLESEIADKTFEIKSLRKQNIELVKALEERGKKDYPHV
jgi:prefoldin subunit 5